MSFKMKIFIIIFVAIYIPAILVSAVMYESSKNAITTQTSKVVTRGIQLSSDNIDASLKSVIGMSDLILTDNNVLTYAKTLRKFTGKEKVRKYGAILDLLSFFTSRIKTLNITDDIGSYYMYLPNQKAIIDSSSTYYESVNAGKADFLRKLSDRRYDGSWFMARPVNYYTLNGIRSGYESRTLITYNRVVKDNSGRTAAVLAININKNFLYENYDKLENEIPGNFLILDKTSTIMDSSNTDEIGTASKKYTEINSTIARSHRKSGSFFTHLDGAEQFVVYYISPYTKWKYLVLVHSSVVLGQVYQFRRLLGVTVAAIAVLVLCITLLLSNIFYKPIEKLVQAMQAVENRNLNVSIQDKRKDEYSRVYQGFNNMIGELNGLIKDLTNEKMVSKEAKIKLIQEQINPHFLYNTLDSIYSIAKIRRVDDIAQMVMALSKFFRISLSGGKDIVTLKDAIGLVESYLTVQNIRFGGRFDFTVDAPESLLRCLVPKMILQPIVENSIYHGIERKKDTGYLLVCARREDDDLFLCVRDDGVGMPRERLDALCASLQSDTYEDAENFALKNLNSLLKLKYGEKYGLSITSVQGEGTEVNIRLPVRLKETL